MLPPISPWHHLLSWNILLDDSCAAVYWVVLGGRTDINVDNIPEPRWILDGAPKTCSLEVPVSRVKYIGNTWNTKFTLYPWRIETIPVLRVSWPPRTLCLPVVVFWSQSFDRPWTAQSTQSNQSQSPGHSCQQKNKTMVKLSIPRVNLVLNANAKFNLAFKQ